MSGRDEGVYVRHMLDAIGRVEKYVSGIDKDSFRADELLQDAVIRQLEVLGEAAGRISKATCTAHPDIPWAKITGLRHRLIHDYFGVDLNMVWKVAVAELGGLTATLEVLLQELKRA